MRGFEQAWTAFGYVVGGVVVWGGVGMGLDALWSTTPVATIVGAVVGKIAGIYLLYVRTMGPAADTQTTATRNRGATHDAA